MICTLLAEAHRRNATLSTVAWLHLALFGAMLLIAPFDSRTVMGINPWVKPMKFAASIAIYLWTIAWFVEYVLDARRATKAIAGGVALVMSIEIICITLQAARGTTSHYNAATLFDLAVFNLMGLGILANTIFGAWLLALFSRQVPLPEAYLWGIRLGLLVFLLGSLEGLVMISKGAHTVGFADGGPGLPFVNWSTQGGDLRVAHALGLHALQVIPLAGHLIARRLQVPAGRQLVLLGGFTVAYLGFSAYLFWAAINGRPAIAI